MMRPWTNPGKAWPTGLQASMGRAHPQVALPPGAGWIAIGPKVLEA